MTFKSLCYGLVFVVLDGLNQTRFDRCLDEIMGLKNDNVWIDVGRDRCWLYCWIDGLLEMIMFVVLLDRWFVGWLFD